MLRSKTQRTVPRWLVRALEKLVHQDECNAFLAQYGELRDFDFLDAFLTRGLNCTYTVHTSGAKSDTNRYVFASNHPLGGLDGIILLLVLHNMGYDVRAIVNDLLLHITPIRGLFVPVNKVGAQAREYVTLQRDLWESEHSILTFPAGACSRWQKGTVSDLEWRTSFVRNAVRYHRDIVPIYFDGLNSSRFYRIAWWRKLLHIKLNLEMMLLPDEMFRARGSHFNVYIGEPVSWQSLENANPRAATATIRQTVYSLPQFSSPLQVNAL
ncbi:MAG: 1-acyl-sn-glycerol-3-phosphate acyltransferase [Paludibacteraceae bacterium]|nr:1-acyl-sn-glycerol-3-phosphate acyltransferase [Paludibacteraceae bacterium]